MRRPYSIRKLKRAPGKLGGYRVLQAFAGFLDAAHFQKQKDTYRTKPQSHDTNKPEFSYERKRMSSLKVKKGSVAAAIAVIVTALIAVSTQVPLAVLSGGVPTVEPQGSAMKGNSPTPSGWAVKGIVHIIYPPCPFGVTCSPIYQITGIGGPACAFPSSSLTSHTACPLLMQQGTWIMYFTPCLPNASVCPQYAIQPPKQGEHIIAYGTDIVPSKNGSNYAGDLYVSSWIQIES